MVKINKESHQLAKHERKERANSLRQQHTLEDKERLLDILKKDPKYRINRKLVRNERDGNKLKERKKDLKEIKKKVEIMKSKKRSAAYKCQELYNRMHEPIKQHLLNIPLTKLREQALNKCLHRFDSDCAASWGGKINELLDQGIISQSAESVTIEGIGTLPRAATHNQIIEEKFPGNFIDLDNQDGHENTLYKIKNRVLNDYMKEYNGEYVSGKYKIPGKEFFTGTFFPWVIKNFKNLPNYENYIRDPRFYGGNIPIIEFITILELINPELNGALILSSKVDKYDSCQALTMGTSRISIHNRLLRNDQSLFLVGEE